MARPAKSVAVSGGGVAKARIRERSEIEETLRGSRDGLQPPDYLTESQRDIFIYVVEEIGAAGILGNLDVYVLAAFAVSVDRLRDVDEYINRHGITDVPKSILAVKDRYSKDFFRGCNELCLSPQARAKIGSLKVAQEKTDPLRAALMGDDES